MDAATHAGMMAMQSNDTECVAQLAGVFRDRVCHSASTRYDARSQRSFTAFSLRYAGIDAQTERYHRYHTLSFPSIVKGDTAKSSFKVSIIGDPALMVTMRSSCTRYGLYQTNMKIKFTRRSLLSNHLSTSRTCATQQPLPIPA
jgi:hypothetical protein